MNYMDPRVENACAAMKKLDISPQRVQPVLKTLLDLYEGNWNFIEAENYRTLVDTIFELKAPMESNTEPIAKRLRSASQKDGLVHNIMTLQNSEILSLLTKGEPSTEPNLANGRVESTFDHQSVLLNNERKDDQIRCKTNETPNGYYLVNTFPNQIAQDGLKRSSKELSVIKKESETSTSTEVRMLTTKSHPQVCLIDDITGGKEKMKISLVNDEGKPENPPKFFYIRRNIVYKNAHVSMSISRISEEDCCGTCSGNCLSSQVPCACARETGGEFAYETNGLLKESFLNANIELKRKPQTHHFVFCSDCPLERFKNESKPDTCKGHLVRRFIKECWSLCGCDIQCGNRILQRGITRNLQVFWTPEGKGWGIRSTEDIPKGGFVFEFAGEILTNQELFERNLKKKRNKRHTYPVCLDADWGSESILKDEEALCLDATNMGNVARFVNHRCGDANLLDIPVQVETMDRHYYHLAFFTTRDVKAYEELTWDYGIDFNDRTHPVEAFQCRCGSSSCEDTTRGGKGKKKPSR